MILQVGTPGTSLKNEAGYLYVVLYDSESLQGKQQLELSPDANGQYSYSFSDVEQGEYLLIVGSDFDNNGAICDFSESCGIYPRLDSANTVITIDKNLSGLDFLVDYEIGFRSSALSDTRIEPSSSGQLPFVVRRMH